MLTWAKIMCKTKINLHVICREGHADETVALCWFRYPRHHPVRTDMGLIRCRIICNLHKYDSQCWFRYPRHHPVRIDISIIRTIAHDVDENRTAPRTQSGCSIGLLFAHLALGWSIDSHFSGYISKKDNFQKGERIKGGGGRNPYLLERCTCCTA